MKIKSELSKHEDKNMESKNDDLNPNQDFVEIVKNEKVSSINNYFSQYSVGTINNVYYIENFIDSNEEEFLLSTVYELYCLYN